MDKVYNDKFDMLPSELQREVMDFIDFLAMKVNSVTGCNDSDIGGRDENGFTKDEVNELLQRVYNIDNGKRVVHSLIEVA